MQNAQKATSELGSEAQKLAQKREAFQALGRGMVVVGGAITAVGLAALKTGVQYNQLQQSTRAALATILGGTQAANAQMDKLDDFARNSPFAKQTFIRAQQQMLAFGIETRKVIPYLDAVQNAVAAAGGSNAEIEGIVATMSKIQSASKITAQDLIEFGNRGINAADLIGSQMGKTGAQIREDITAGSLDATRALDALAAGMSERFAGAADNVKDTFAGAMDRVKAAWRDFGSVVAEPLVDPNGGGALVDLLNGVADLTRGFLDLPKPVQNAITTMGGATGAFLVLGGTVIALIPKFAAAKVSLAALGVTARSTMAFLGGPWGLAIGAAVGALGLFAYSSAHARERIRELSGTLDENTGAFTENTRALVADRLMDNMFGLADKAEAFGISLELLTDAAMGNKRAMSEVESQFHSARDAMGSDNPLSLTPWKEFEYQLGSISGELVEAQDRHRKTAEAVQGGTRAVEDAVSAYSGFKIAADDGSNALDAMTGAAQIASDRVRGLSDQIRGFASVTMTAREAERAFEESLDALTTSLAENGSTLDITTQSGRENERALYDLATRAKEFAAMTWEQTGSQDAATEALQRGRDELINQLAQFGITGEAAQAYADDLGLIPDQISTTLELLTRNALAAAEAFVQEWQGKRITMSMFLDTTNGDRGAAAAAARYTGLAQSYLNAPGRAGGGDLDSAPGPVGRDSKLFWGAKGEHVLTASEVARMGGQSAVYAFRRQLMSGRTSAPASRMVGPSMSSRSVTVNAPAVDMNELVSAIRSLEATAASPMVRIAPASVTDITEASRRRDRISERMGDA